MRLPGRPSLARARPRWRRGARSLRTRLLVATTLIAVGAIAATAWLTSRGTTDRLRDDVTRDIGVDDRIYSELLAYAETHPAWDGVDSLVAGLAESTGRRIALTTESGRMIVDSARLDGGDSPLLPRRPVVVVDPLNPVGSIYAGAEQLTTEAVSSPSAYTDEELAAGQEEADAVAVCLGQAGVAYTVATATATATDEGGFPLVDVDWDDDAAVAAYDQCSLAVAEGAGGSQPSGPEGSDSWEVLPIPPEEAQLNDEVDGYLQRCLDRRGIAYTTVDLEDIPTTDIVDYEDPVALAAYDECVTAANEAVYGPRFADPVRLYLGSQDRVGLAVLDAGRGPMLVAGGLVALLAVGVTVPVSRRMLRPVVALTDAAQRMAAGDLTCRVEVGGQDELSELARSFNSMANAIATNEEQRKRMVNDVAHELRNPLANIRGYVEAALDGVTLADDKLLGSLHEEALLLQRLVDDLQTLALAEAGRLALHRKPTDVVELAATVISAHQPQAEGSGIELVLDDPAASLVVDGDTARLRQAVGNLVSNALRYTPADGTVTVRVRRDGDDHVRVDVRDTGLGIADDDLPHVFERFWRADRSRTRDTGGSGLGLAITRELVTAHDGIVQATSRMGEGSTFSIRLPLAGR